MIILLLAVHVLIAIALIGVVLLQKSEGGALGMGGSLLSYEAVEEGPVSSRNLTGRVLAMADTRDRAELLLRREKERATQVLIENRDVLEALRDALLARDELVGEEIVGVIRAALDARRLRAMRRHPAAGAGPKIVVVRPERGPARPAAGE